MFSRTTSMWALVAVTVPCPVSLLLCNGLLPPAAVVVVAANLVVREPLLGWGMAGVLAVEVAVMLWLLRWIARRVVDRGSPHALAVTAAGLILASLAPLYFLDCMDGHGLTRCSIPMMLRAGMTEGRQCGDLGW